MKEETIKKEIEIKTYIAKDGELFYDKDACEKYEEQLKNKNIHPKLDKWTIDCLKNRWIFMSLAEFIPCAGHGFSDDDGCGNFLMCDVHGHIFESNWDDLYDLRIDDDDELDDKIKELRKKYDTKDHFIMGVMWYNK